MPPPPPRSAQAEERWRGDAARDPGALRLPSFASARLSSPRPDTPPHPQHTPNARAHAHTHTHTHTHQKSTPNLRIPHTDRRVGRARGLNCRESSSK